MEDLGHHHHQENMSSDEMFSFPGTPSDGGEFEFGSVTPASPFCHDDPDKTSPSPADQFFLNGRLLPHSFPAADKSTRNSTSENSRTTSRTSSVSSKDSLVSSRSNSTNSRSSTCSSARTSSSEISERRMLVQSKIASRTASTRERCGKNNNNSNKNKNMLGQQPYQFGTSQRWQFISPVPVLGPSRSRRRRSSSMEFGLQGKMSPTKKEDEEKGSEGGSGFVQRFFRSFVKSCKACHAMDMECVVDDNDLDFEGKIKSELK